MFFLEDARVVEEGTEVAAGDVFLYYQLVSAFHPSMLQMRELAGAQNQEFIPSSSLPVTLPIFLVPAQSCTAPLRNSFPRTKLPEQGSKEILTMAK